MKTFKLLTFIAFCLSLGFSSCKQGNTQTITSEKMETGIIIKTSTKDFETTYNSLQTVINNNPNLKIIAELDHSKNAGNVDLTLRPTKIILFGNPKLGTPLMNDSATTSLDLPQKIVVFQDDNGSVKVAYNDPFYLKQRHDINDVNHILEKISGALNKITDAAINN